MQQTRWYTYYFDQGSDNNLNNNECDNNVKYNKDAYEDLYLEPKHVTLNYDKDYKNIKPKYKLYYIGYICLLSSLIISMVFTSQAKINIKNIMPTAQLNLNDAISINSTILHKSNNIKVYSERCNNLPLNGISVLQKDNKIYISILCKLLCFGGWSNKYYGVVSRYQFGQNTIKTCNMLKKIQNISFDKTTGEFNITCVYVTQPVKSMIGYVLLDYQTDYDVFLFYE